MNVLIAVDKFKGSLTAAEAASAIANGLPSSCSVDFCPIADGGEGFAETIAAALTGHWVTFPSQDALNRELEARYYLTADGLAVMEMAETNGLTQIDPSERNPHFANTFGTGLMIRHAAEESRARKILIGIGGSATNDGGTGAAQALGVRFLDSSNRELKTLPFDLSHLDRIDTAARCPLPPIEVACDVTNPLLGPQGATAVFGPQKGVQDMPTFEYYLTRLAEKSSPSKTADLPGAGAAGGLGFGLVQFAGAQLRSGSDIVMEATQLLQRIQNCDIVITGEGSLDSQSLSGKGPAEVALAARKLGKPVVALAGRVTPEVVSANLFSAFHSLDSESLPLSELMQRAAELLQKKTRELVESSGLFQMSHS